MFENHKLEKVLLAISLIGWIIFLWVLSRPAGGMFAGLRYWPQLLISVAAMFISGIAALMRIFVLLFENRDKVKITLSIISIFPAIHYILLSLNH